MLIEVFSAPGCSKCMQTRKVLRRVVDELSEQYPVEWREVNIVEEVEYALKVGITGVPSIAVDGRVVFVDLPTPDQLRRTIEEAFAS